MPFFDRTDLLKMLDRTFARPSHRLTILYGVPGVGQTALLQRWLKTRKHRALYFAPSPATAEEHLQAFTQAVWTFSHPDTPIPADFHFRDWEAALLEIDRLATQANGLIVVLDNFDALLAADAAMPDHIKTPWDLQLQHGRAYLILAGGRPSPAYMSRMLSYSNGALYGRADSTSLIRPLSFEAASCFAPHFSPAERITLYACLDGFPVAWQQINPDQSMPANLRRIVLSPEYEQVVRERVRGSVKDFKGAEAILRAMAAGAAREENIEWAARVGPHQMRRCLYQLQRARLVDQPAAAFPVPISLIRVPPWHIRDHQVHFYYRFLARERKSLTPEQGRAAWPSIWRALPDFVRRLAFRDLCHLCLYRAWTRHLLPASTYNFGGYWPEAQPALELIGYSDDLQTLVLTEYFWGNRPVGPNLIRAFIRRATKSLPAEVQGAEVSYAFFSKAGFTSTAREAVGGHRCLWIDLPVLEEMISRSLPKSRQLKIAF